LWKVLPGFLEKARHRNRARSNKTLIDGRMSLETPC
jgi:hypothetical protein